MSTATLDQFNVSHWYNIYLKKNKILVSFFLFWTLVYTVETFQLKFLIKSCKLAVFGCEIWKDM